MEDRHDQIAQTEETPSPKPPMVVGHFCIEKQCYLIIAHVNGSEDQLKSELFQDSALFEQAERIPLVVNGKSCLVIEIQQAVAEANYAEANYKELLSDRELQIAQLVAQGQSNKQIAQQLQISKWTVLTHLRRIFSKLNVDSRAAMVYQLCGHDLNRSIGADLQSSPYGDLGKFLKRTR
ncbi:MAG: LuxR C-terminal-related transcriptional regulator [Elainella sp. Prado103]|jgi:DNA-binding CsgD family transcriptional regulator|nr:LuxR C-terminal-related transcriptional regulator [Elainella sp. Prado103]